MKTTICDNQLRDELVATAEAMIAPGKGILAADESSPTIKKRFSTINVESTEENRRYYRELLLTTKGLEDFISGVILFDETLRQGTEDGVSFPDLLAQKEILPGIKVDMGLVEIPGTAGEKVTQGLDGLGVRLDEYRELGARFAKWRAVISIGHGVPGRLCLDSNAHALARYAALCQSRGMVPIVEPEVLMEGSHGLLDCERVMDATLSRVFNELIYHGVILEGMILKPSMVTPGSKSSESMVASSVAEATIRSFKRTVPAAVPGVVFLSGGQSSEEATRNLNAMNKIGNVPWELSFSYGRALQEKTLEAWAGKAENKPNAQRILYHRAKCNGAARFGKYTEGMEAEIQ